MMNNYTIDEEAPEVRIVVPAILDGDKSSPIKKKTCCILTMEIIKIFFIVCMSLFLLIWSVIQFLFYDNLIDGNAFTGYIGEADEFLFLLILATLFYFGAMSLDAVLGIKESCAGNTIFGLLGIFAAICWLFR